MSVLEIVGITWIILIICNLILGFLGISAGIDAESRKQEDAEIQKAINTIINSNNQIIIEIIKFDNATIYYAYHNLTRRFLTQGYSEQEVLDNLSKKYKNTQFQIIGREHVGTTY